LFGYYSARSAVTHDHAVAVRRRLTDFAECEGFALAALFAETAEQPAVALQALIDSAGRRQVLAVAVSAPSDLGTHEITQHVTRERLETAGLRVLVVPRDGGAE
jgi:hypothetical protein